jgi:transposase-like protein
MNAFSVPPPSRQRRRYSPEFKTRIVEACKPHGASVSRIALDNGLNANMVRRWIREAEDPASIPQSPGFLPIALPSPPVTPSPACATDAIRIEIPRAGGPVVIEWPADRADQCLALLRSLLP